MAENKQQVARGFGVLAALALAALVTYVSVASMDVGNSFGGIVLMFLVLVIGGPLLLITVGITLYLAARSALSSGLAALMWVPIVVSLSIIPVTDYLISKNVIPGHPATQGAGHAGQYFPSPRGVIAGYA